MDLRILVVDIELGPTIFEYFIADIVKFFNASNYNDLKFQLNALVKNCDVLLHMLVV